MPRRLLNLLIAVALLFMSDVPAAALGADGRHVLAGLPCGGFAGVREVPAEAK